MSFVQGAALPKRHILILFILFLLCAVYNLWKPFHVDDAAHLEIAKWISANPLHPLSGLLNWGGVPAPIFETNQPHLFFYALAIWGSIFGYSEPSLHSLLALIALGCILVTYSIASRLIPSSAPIVTVLTILNPAFIVEQNIMVDTSLLLFWLIFYKQLICQTDSKNQTGRYVIAACACSIALLIKYSSLVLIMVLFISLIIEQRWRLMWVLVIPMLTITLWSAFNYIDYGKIHILARSISSDRVRLFGSTVSMSIYSIKAIQLFAWIVTVGSLLPIGWCFICWRRQIYLYIIAVLFLILGFAVANNYMSDHISDIVLAALFFINGLAVTVWVIYLFVVKARKFGWITPSKWDLRYLYIFIWISSTSVFYVFLAPFVAARHVLLLIPAIYMLLFMAHEEALTNSTKVFMLIWTACLALGLGLSDWRFAEFYKESASVIASDLAKTPDGSSKDAVVWTSGHWGWQWYSAQVGFRQIDVKNIAFRKGDYFVVAEDVDHQTFENKVAMSLIRQYVEKDPELNLICSGRLASLYAAKRGSWTLSRNCGGKISVYRIDESPN